jgi:hypothetical protein
MKRITYRKLSDIANILVAAAVESSDTMLLAVHSSLLQLTRIVRRQSVDFTVLQKVLTQAEQSNATSTTNAPQAMPISAQAAVPQYSMQPIVPQVTTNHYLPPVPAVGQSKEGPTRKRRFPSQVMAMNGGSQQTPVPNQRRPPACSFCKQVGHKIKSCPQTARLGRHLPQNEITPFCNDKLSASRACALPSQYQCTNMPVPCLTTISNKALYLVIHGIYFKNMKGPEAFLRDAGNLCVLVQFVGPGGAFMDGKSTVCVVELKAVTDKIARLHNVKSSTSGTMCKVFSQIE